MVHGIELNRSYHYISSTIQPLEIQEYFPMKIEIDSAICDYMQNAYRPNSASNPSNFDVDYFVDLLQKDFAKKQKSIEQELDSRGISHKLALGFYLSCAIHVSKHYTPKNVSEDVVLENLTDYFCNLQYAHCSQKAHALDMLLGYFDIKSHRIGYSDILGWTHGFCEVLIDDEWQILDPTFNMYFNINVRDIIQNPFCVRKVLSFYSNEFYADNGKEHLDFIQTQLDNQKHSTFKYNREWFMFMGFHTYKPAVLWFHQIENGQTTEIYDIRKDSRYRFV